MNRYKCSECGRFIKAKEIKATKEQIDKLGYPKEYVEFICAKCGKLSSWGVEIITTNLTRRKIRCLI